MHTPARNRFKQCPERRSEAAEKLLFLRRGTLERLHDESAVRAVMIRPVAVRSIEQVAHHFHVGEGIPEPRA